jgi:hypothetical protein
MLPVRSMCKIEREDISKIVKRGGGDTEVHRPWIARIDAGQEDARKRVLATERPIGIAPVVRLCGTQ